MIKDKTQKIESGDNSNNYQAETINQYGLSYREVKDLALDVFRENFLIFSEQAKQIAGERAEELIDNLLNEIKEKNPDLLNSFQEPGMQNALYTAQKSYAISGDKDTAELLVDILIDRAEQNERNTRQIVLDESLKVVSKLTNQQLDILTVVFILKYTMNNGLNDLGALKKYLEDNIKPFTDNLTKEHSAYQHLEYCNCGSVSVIDTYVELMFLERYKGLFCKGIEPKEFEQYYADIPELFNLLCPCLHDNTKLQLKSLNDDVFRIKAKESGVSEENTQKLIDLLNSNLMNRDEVKEYLLKQGAFMEEFLDVWNNSSLDEMTITSVGIAIAQANYKRKTGRGMDLSIWIK